MQRYLGSWGIELNCSKTKVMFAKPRRKDGNKRVDRNGVNAGGTIVMPGEYLKYLGVTFEHKGDFDMQATMAFDKGRQAAGAASRLLKHNLVQAKIKDMIYKQMIRSRVGYATQIWYRGKKIKNRTDVMERDVFRRMVGAKRYPDNKVRERGEE